MISPLMQNKLLLILTKGLGIFNKKEEKN